MFHIVIFVLETIPSRTQCTKCAWLHRRFHLCAINFNFNFNIVLTNFDSFTVSIFARTAKVLTNIPLNSY